MKRLLLHFFSFYRLYFFRGVVFILAFSFLEPLRYCVTHSLKNVWLIESPFPQTFVLSVDVVMLPLIGSWNIDVSHIKTSVFVLFREIAWVFPVFTE